MIKKIISLLTISVAANLACAEAGNAKAWTCSAFCSYRGEGDKVNGEQELLSYGEDAGAAWQNIQAKCKKISDEGVLTQVSRFESTSPTANLFRNCVKN